MAERYIFNESLNRRKNPWYWLAIVAFTLCLYSLFSGLTLAAQQRLLDPQQRHDLSSQGRVTQIDFTRDADSTGVILVSLSESSTSAQLIESQGKVTVTLANTQLDDDQLVELNVVEFATPVTAIETFQDGENTRIEIRYQGAVLARHTVNDGLLRVEVQPMSQAQQDLLENEAKYTGKPISLDFQDVPVRQVLQIIAQVNNFNLVTTDTVNGNVTISLSGVPWDQALDMILRVRGLDKRLEGNILLIAPTEELMARETQALQSKKASL